MFARCIWMEELQGRHPLSWSCRYQEQMQRGRRGYWHSRWTEESLEWLPVGGSSRVHREGSFSWPHSEFGANLIQNKGWTEERAWGRFLLLTWKVFWERPVQLLSYQPQAWKEAVDWLGKAGNNHVSPMHVCFALIAGWYYQQPLMLRSRPPEVEVEGWSNFFLSLYPLTFVPVSQEIMGYLFGPAEGSFFPQI